MKSKTLTFVGGIVLLAALAAPVRLSAQKQIHYTVIDIGTLPDGTFSQAFGINNNGDVVEDVRVLVDCSDSRCSGL